MNDDLEHLRKCLQNAAFVPHEWNNEDRNLGAFRSKDELIAWYCQPPGAINQPYRDRGFYCRELAMLSRLVQPRRIVEFGTSLGIGTCLLHWLNPTAHITTVDVATVTFLPGDQRVPMGYIARHQNIPCEYITMTSWEYTTSDVDLCFIDAEHTYESVLKDSEHAWQSRSGHWAIVWHDHNDRHSGVMTAVKEFCSKINMPLQSREDSDTVWITNINRREK